MKRKLFYLLVALTTLAGFLPGGLPSISPPPALANGEPLTNFTLTLMSNNATVVKGEIVTVPIRVVFLDGFTSTGGVTFQVTSNVSLSANFTPTPLKNTGGVALKIDTSSLTAGIYLLTVQANEASSLTQTANFTLKIVTTSDIKFFEYDQSYNVVYLNSKNVNKQGVLEIYVDGLDSDGNPLMAPITLQSDNPGVLGIYEANMGRYIYALQTGSAALIASAPDGYTENITINVTVPADPAMTSISLTPSPITNKYTDNLTFWATGTQPISWYILGMLSDNMKDDTMDWSNESKTYGGNFKINDANHPGLGSYIFGAYIPGANSTKAADVAKPLTIENDPTYGSISGGVLTIDPSLMPWQTEMFNLEFYQGGILQFSRIVFMHPGAGTGKVYLGSITPGTYKIKYVPMDAGIKPQWYPNADNISSASDVTLQAGPTTQDIYFFAMSAAAPPPPPPPPPPPLLPGMQWSQTFGGASNDDGYSVQQTPDGGYIVSGQTGSFGAGGSDAYLVKTNASGNMTWSQTFGAANHDYAFSVQPTLDGGYIVAGNTYSFGAGNSDVYLIKTNSSGNMTWSQTFGGAAYDYGKSVQPTADGGYIIGGSTESFGAGNSDVWLIKTDASGNVTWSQTFGGTNEDAGYSVQPTADGGYIIGGYTRSFGAGDLNVYLIKTNASGNMTWSQTFGGTGDDLGYSVQQTADGGYIIANRTQSFGAGLNDVYLIKTNASGNMTWSQTFGGTNHDIGGSVRQTTDGGYIIAGWTNSFGAGNYDAYLIKTNDSGNMTWSQTFGGTNDDYGYSVQPTTDGGFIIGGATASFGADGGDVYLIKVAAPAAPPPPPALNQIAFNSTRDGNNEIYVMNPDGSAQTRLTDNPADDAIPTWSPDRTKIAFHSNRDGNYEIYVMNADGSGQTNISNNASADSHPSWSTDGAKIVFYSDRDGNAEIYVMNADGSSQTRLTDNPAVDGDPSLSPDGTKIVFMSNRDGGNWEVYVMNADGSGQTNLSNNAGTEGDPTWSPDGTKISFRSDRTGNYQIYVMNAADGSSQTRLTYNSAWDLQTTWCPDGSKIAFTTNRDGNTQIYIMNADGSGQTRLTDNAGDDRYPAWTRFPVSSTPSGMPFVSDRDANLEIYTMWGDGSNQTRVTDNSIYDNMPSLSPDGSKIAFVSASDGNREVYVMSANGTGITQLTSTDNVGNEWPTWSPDGSRIAFASDRAGGYNEIYTVNATDGSGLVQLTSNSTFGSVLPAWSPDGTKIAFSSARDGGYGEIYVMNAADGSGLTRLTNHPAPDMYPDWSPDGSRIAFSSSRTGNMEIYVMNADSSNVTQLTTNSATDWQPLFCQDGSSIFFSSDRDGNWEVYRMDANGANQTALSDNPAGDWLRGKFQPPAVTTDNASTITTDSVVLNGNLTNLGSIGKVKVAFQWGLTAGNYTGILPVAPMTATGVFSANLTGLSANTTYYVRARANGDGINLGVEKSFTTTDTSLVAKYTFDDGTANDSSAYGNNGTIYGATVVDSPIAGGGKALSFNNNYVSVPNTDSLNPSYITVEAWVYPTSYGYYRSIVNKEYYSYHASPWSVYILKFREDTAKPSFWIAVNGVVYDAISSDVVPMNVWTHWVGTYDGETLKIYVNGVLAGSDTAPSGPLDNRPDAPLYIGATSGTNQYYYGKIDEVAIYNGALTAEEIAEHYQSGLELAPTVTTDNTTSITSTSARLNGTLTNLGTAATANVSFQWGMTSGNYTFETTSVSMNATGVFSTNLTGLSGNTTYHFRAKAVGDGIAYGNDETFTTALEIFGPSFPDWGTITPQINDAGDMGAWGGGPFPPPDIASVSVADNGTYIYFRIVANSANPGIPLTINIDADQSTATGYNTDTDLDNKFGQPHGMGVDYYIHIQAQQVQQPPVATLYSVAGPGWNPVLVGILPSVNFTAPSSPEDPAPYVVQLALPLSSIAGEYPWNLVFGMPELTPGGPWDEAPNNTHLTYPVQLQAGKPDLIILEKHEEWIVPGSTYIVRFIIKNTGNATAPAGHDVALSVDGILTEQQEVPVSLDPGASYTNYFTTITLSGTSDSIIVAADANNEVDELNETNNTRTNTWSVSKPDLTIIEKHEVWVQQGSTYVVYYTVKNQGSANASAGYDMALQVDNNFIEKKPIPVSLAPSANYTDNFTTIVNLSGSYDSVTVVADINNEVDESSETNNRSYPLTIAWPPAPDLSMYKWETWVPGQSGNYTVNFRVSNWGNAEAPAGHDAQLVVDGQVIETKQVLVTLAPNTSYTSNFTTVIAISAGIDKVKVTADINSEVAEPNEGNNVYENTIALPQAPDLVIFSKSEQWLPGYVGNYYSVYFGVRNIGNAEVPAGHEVQLVVDGVPIETKVVPVSLAQGSTWTDFFSTNVTYSPSSDNITVIADINNVVAESDENNNWRWNIWSAPGGTITGCVIDTATSLPIANLHVYALDFMTRTWVAGANTNASGNYTLTVPTGTYMVGTSPMNTGLNYVAEYYNNKYGGHNADPVPVVAPGNTANIDFSLQLGSIIRGRVTDNTTGLPIANLHVNATDNITNVWTAGANTDASGNYTMVVPTGSYWVYACASCNGQSYVNEWYDNAYNRNESTIVFVTTPNITPGIDFSLEPKVIRTTIEESTTDGINWLVSQQNPDGSWGTQYPVAKTGLAVLKLATHATANGTSPLDAGYPYRNNILNGLTYLFSNAYTTNITMQLAGNPDGDGDGIGVYFCSPDPYSHPNHAIEVYETSIALMAISATNSPDQVINIIEAAVNGWTFRQVAQDTLDYIAWAQTDWGYGRGGWNYTAMNNSGDRSDQSNSGWASLALAYAEAPAPDGFNLVIPGFVRSELNLWIDYIQDDVNGDESDGGAWYSGPGTTTGKPELERSNILRTGNLLQQMAFAGDTLATPRVQAATDYLVRHWSDNNSDPGWRGNYHATYTVMKGLEAFNADNITSGNTTINWFQDFVDALLWEQYPDGSWPESNFDDGEQILSTEWALLTLEKTTAPTRIGPDLVVSGKYEEWVDEGAGTYRVFYTITNEGNSNALSGHTVALFIDGVNREEKVIPAVLSAGGFFSDNFSTIVTLSGVTDNITVSVDIYNTVAELNEQNNSMTNGLPAAPDLTIDNKWEWWQDQQAGQYRVGYVVKNSGNVLIPGGHSVGLTIDGIFTENQTISHDLVPGDSYQGTFNTVVVLSGLSDNITVTADIGNLVVEVNEENNSRTNIWPAEQPPPPPQQPDLTIIDKHEEWIVPGSSYKVFFTVKNISGTTEILRPNGAGSETSVDTQYPSSGSHWEKVAEAAADDDSTYIENKNGAAESWQRDLFALPNHTGYGNIANVSIYIRTAHNISDAKASIRTHGITYDSPGITNTDIWKTYSYTWANNPSTGVAWTWDEIDTLEAGVSLQGSNGSPDWSRCTQVYVVINDDATVPSGHDMALQVDGILIEQKAVSISLAPGDTYSDNFTTTVNLSGSYDSVTVTTDFNNEVAESSETNNRRSNTFAWPPAPDLNVYKWETWVPGQTGNYTVNFRISNQGNAEAPVGHDAQLVVDGQIIETKEVPVALAPLASYTGNFTTVITLSGGVDKVKVTTDINNEVPESIEGNNAYENTIAWPAAPDFTVFTKSEQWLQGSTTQYNVFFGVRNIGNAPAPAGFDVQLKVDGVAIQSLPILVALNQGSTYSGMFSANVTISGSSDNVSVTADISSVVAESDETNNERWNIWSVPAKPDLTLVETHENWTAPGVSYVISYTIKNNGSATAPAGHSAMLMVDNKPTEFKPVPVSLAPGANYTDTFATIVNLSGTSDSVYAFADAYSEVDESNETNNRRWSIVAWPPAPELTVTKWETWVQQGSQYIVNFRVGNAGNAEVPPGHDAQLTVDGQTIETKEVSLALAPGASYTSNFTTVVNLTDGMYRVKVTADIYNELSEPNETNNNYENTIAWPQAPNLAIGSKWELWAQGSTTQYYVFFDILNMGNAVAPAGHDVQLIVDDTVIQTMPIPLELNPGTRWLGMFSANVSISGSSDNVTVIADINNEVAESDENNNGRWNILSAMPKPNLTIAEKHEIWVIPGANYTISYTVKNTGSANASAGFDVSLSIDGQPIETKQVPVSLGPSANYTDTFTTVVNLTGSWDSVSVTADIYGEVDESNELDNSRPNTFAWPPAADLSISNKYEEWVEQGSLYKVHFNIRNAGNAPAPAGHDVQLKIDGIVRETQAVPIIINPNEVYQGVFNYTANFTPAIDKVEVTADINNEVPESREDNNSLTNTFAWPPAPDLIIFSKIERWTDNTSTQYTVRYSIRNIGNAPAPAGFDVQLKVDGVVKETMSVPWTINPGGPPGYSGGFATVITLSGGSDNVTVIADANNEVIESDEGNNTLSNTWPYVEVRINAPAKVAADRDFTAIVNISQVQSFDAANFDVSFNPAVLRLDDVTSGNIGGATVPVTGLNEREPGRFTIVVNLTGLTGANGTGSLAALHFHVIGSLGQSSTINLSSGVLSNTEATEILATWLGDFVEAGIIPGDANGDGIVNALDITKVERIIARLDPSTPGADANEDGNVNALDITKVERKIVGLDLD